MTPERFVKEWAGSRLGEMQSYQLHFADVCRLAGHETPGGDGVSAAGQIFVFEQSLTTGQGGHGYADVYYEGHFAIEYKSPQKYKDLSAAYHQLLGYREALNNPPLLVVTDINNWEIHTNFPNTSKTVYRFKHEDIADHLELLRNMFHAPERLHPRRAAEQVTQDAAKAFERIADNMRDWDADPQRIAYFLTKLVFCLFAEDIGLLPPAVDSPDGIFTFIIEHSRQRPGIFQQYLRNLFVAMKDGGDFLLQDIRYFNGALFDVVNVEKLSVEAIDALAEAARLDWANIEPSIFGTLFERSLDPAKRSQLGAHYTSRDDILLIVEPVLMQPLRYAWDTIQLRAEPVREQYDNARNQRIKTNARRELLAMRGEILERVRSVTVLDPACGSGNFLYVSLQMLMDLEKEIIRHRLWKGLQIPAPAVHPRQMYGIEINPIAHALASIVVWIGFIQWRQKNGYHNLFGEPILEKLGDNIVCKDAILPPVADPPRSPAANPPRSPHQAGGKLEMVEWPEVNVIVGNPPFLGGQRMRGELGDEYFERLTKHYSGIIASGADLVCYWFENARAQIEQGRAKRAGLLATNSIRGGSNRVVLQRIKESGDIFMAWSDRPWILDGASVRVSMIGFDGATQAEKTFDGEPAESINSDLTSTVDITSAAPLQENLHISFQGPVKVGNFDINNDKAQKMFNASNHSGADNAEVIKPFRNGSDLVQTLRNYWIIDFHNMDIEQARQYEAPFKYVEDHIKPVRQRNKNRKRRENWWKLGASGREYRDASSSVRRQIFTSRVAKYRLFVWVDRIVFPGDAVVAIARDDDYFFGVLHSKLHELWSLRMGTWLGKGNDPRYTPTTTFETFPFPWPPGSEDTSHPAHERISAAAKQLHEERQAWLHPNPLGRPREAKDRTLTNLYNALQVCRGAASIKVKAAAADFAPRLDALHRELDEAVCEAYGWGVGALEDEEEILRRLLALNLARAGEV